MRSDGALGGPKGMVAGDQRGERPRQRISLADDDPLGLGDHPRVRRAAADAAERYGAGAAATWELPGSPAIRLERGLAELLGGEGAVLFGSARDAARAAVVAAAQRDCLVAIDERSSCGLADGARASGAEILSFRHLDVGQLATALRANRRRSVVIATDSVFEENGATAPLQALAAIATRVGARLVVDESHAVGTVAEGGRGAAAAAGMAAGHDVVLTGSLGHALGSQGGFACAAGPALEAMMADAASAERPAPPACGAALAALGLLAGSPGLLASLARNAHALREALADQGFDVGRGGAHIVTIAAGDPRKAAALTERSLAGGVAVEDPGMPALHASRSRVRLRTTAAHRADDLRRAARILGQAAREVGIIGPAAGRLGQPPATRAA